MTARERARDILDSYITDGTAYYAVEEIEAAGIRLVTDGELDELCAQRSAQAGAWRAESPVDDAPLASDLPTIRREDVVGGRFEVRDQVGGIEKELGAWMVHLPSGVGAACADHASYLQNSVACVRALQAGLAATEAAK